MTLPSDYTERVYAGVLGKIIGVYLGRPFEGWSYDAIMENLGEINYYVHEKLDVPLIVTDDDISGTFTFLRALPDYGNSLDLTPAQIGQTWLNYLIEERTILWWGGMGNSTEHTAYLRLKNGIEAPRSGSMELNGKVVAEQIGSQIFIDGWAMVAPGDPEYAADLAKRASQVSHDGEAIYGAQVMAAMESQAFVESDLNKLIDTAVELIPKDSVIYRMIGDIREWHAKEPNDWRKNRELIEGSYGYDKYGGNCHMVPNHGLIIHSLLHGDDDFQKSLMIVNTCGWDTDCNSGNVGCLLGIKNGLAGIDDAGPDFRGPVADRMYLPTADGGRTITDAVTETMHVVNIGRAMAGESPESPKNGALYHFELSGSVQGFMSEESIETKGAARVENVAGYSVDGGRSLAIHFDSLATGRMARVGTPTFTPSKEIADYFSTRGYALYASPKLYPGQTVSARVAAAVDNGQSVQCCVYARYYGKNDELIVRRSDAVDLAAGADHVFEWAIPEMDAAPYADVGIEVSSARRASGTIYLDYLTWSGSPNMVLKKPEYAVESGRRHWGKPKSMMWRHAWVNGMDDASYFWPEAFRVIHNEGTGLLMQGAREWTDYAVNSSITLHLTKSGGVAVRVQGMRRYYALLLCDDGKARLVKALDGNTVLAEVDYAWDFGETHEFDLTVEGNQLVGKIDGKEVLTAEDGDRPLDGGGIALVCEVGRMMTEEVSVRPV